MFKSTTGEKLTEIQAHDDEVLCCAYSPDDRLLATCSSDRKVKVGKLPSHNRDQWLPNIDMHSFPMRLRFGMQSGPYFWGSLRRSMKSRSTTASSPTPCGASCWSPAPTTRLWMLRSSIVWLYGDLNLKILFILSVLIFYLMSIVVEPQQAIFPEHHVWPLWASKSLLFLTWWHICVDIF